MIFIRQLALAVITGLVLGSAVGVSLPCAHDCTAPSRFTPSVAHVIGH